MLFMCSGIPGFTLQWSAWGAFSDPQLHGCSAVGLAASPAPHQLLSLAVQTAINKSRAGPGNEATVGYLGGYLKSIIDFQNHDRMYQASTSLHFCILQPNWIELETA